MPIRSDGGHQTRTIVQLLFGDTSVTGMSLLTRWCTQLAWVTRICRSDSTRVTTATWPFDRREERRNTRTLPATGARVRMYRPSAFCHQSAAARTAAPPIAH